MLSTPWRRVIAALIVVMVLIAGYHFGRRWEAGWLASSIRAMPGVSAAEVQYQSNMTTGTHFDLDVTLADTATAAQAAAVGRAFVDWLRDGYFPDLKVSLNVAYQADRSLGSVTPGSTAEFDYNFDMFARGGPSSSAVADNLALWLRVARTPTTVGVRLKQPAWAGPDDSREIIVYPAPTATDAEIAGLIHEHPQLTAATWEIDVASPQPLGQARSYRIRGPFPSQERRDLWRRIVDFAGDGYASAATDTIAQHPGVPPTSVEINVRLGSREDQRFQDLAYAVTALLPGLGLPITYRLYGEGSGQHVEFYVGGCRPPDRGRVPSALESELRRQYERC